MPKKKEVIDAEVNPLFGDEDFVEAPDLFEAAPEPEPAPEPEVKPEEPKAELTAEQKEEMLAIVDAIMFEGEYSEVIPFGRKYKVTFRSRTAGEDNEISQKLDGRVFNTMISYQNQSSLLTMAYSLKNLNGTDYADMKVSERYKVVAGLPSALVIVLSGLMAEFDRKVLEAMEYGKENF